jgi:hypothetical protein
MNITTIAELIYEFALAETEILNKQDIKHPTTIGTMYEGLTAEVLNKSIFQGLNLKVIKNSFILGCDTEFDVLLVEGEGESIPYTDRFKYKPEQVIAVIQVKKNLYSKDIEEGYNNLKFLIDYFEPREPEKFVGRLFRDSFRQICRKDVTARKSGELSENEELLFHTLRIEAFLPVRIIWGYNGFASEYNFRNSFYEYLENNITTDVNDKKGGFGPHNFPNLIICGQYSMFKNNAMPFIVPVQEDNWWPFYATSSYNPTYYFLELIWTRLSYKFEQIPNDVFGEDLTMEPATRFLDCRMQELNGHQGWEYNNILVSDKNLKANTEVAEWQPVEVDITQHVIISQLCEKGEIDLEADKDLESFVMKGSYSSLADFLEKLKATGLVYVENNKLQLLTDQCQCAIMPNGKRVAGENKSGRFTNWMKKEIAKSKTKNEDNH